MQPYNTRETITRKMVNDRLTEFEKTRLPAEGPEPGLLDKANPNKIGSRKDKRKKVWLLEYKWLNEDDFKKYHTRQLFGSPKYSTEWQNERWNKKFRDERTARDHFRSFNGHGLGTFWDRTTGREYRLRNTETGEIITLP